MNAIKAIEQQLPAHVIAAVTSAAGIVSRRLKHEYGVTVGKSRLRSQGFLFCDQQAREMDQYRAAQGLSTRDGDARHPRPDQQEFVRDCMVVEMMDRWTTAPTGPTSVRRLTPVEEAALVGKLNSRGVRIN